ncbi:MAG: phage tail domain-containing protein [Microgenomates group bacterium]
MSFYGANFIYNNIISSEYGLHISSAGESDSTDGSDVELYTQELYRRPKLYLLGVQQTPVLKMPITINVEHEISAIEDSVISNWLFGGLSYKKLQIIQPDMQYVYYNCIFTGKKTERVGNIIRGYSGEIVCDSPFAWEYPKTISYNYGTSTYTVNDSITINNDSDNADYTYPSVTFKMNSFGGNLSIINTSESSRTFTFTGLSPSEQITVDNDLQIITSNMRTNAFPYFTNYKWLRYIKGNNNFTISGNIESISFTHQFAKKIS